ncbi:MAG: threonine-phosphate decarboxylase [Nitrospirota bacterium]
MKKEGGHFDPIENRDNIYRLAEELKMAERSIIDFSLLVNPLGVSKKIKAELRKHLKYLNNYPDPEAGRLRKRLAQYHGVEQNRVVCGNGSTELIHLIVRTLRPGRALIPAPTYEGYERAIHANQEGHECLIQHFSLNRGNGFLIDPSAFIAALTMSEASGSATRKPEMRFDMAFLCNPNYPTGRLIKKEDVLRIAEASLAARCYLVVDEAFMDFTPGHSVVEEVMNNPYLIVLRTMTYFYSLAGLRIGYGIFPAAVVGEIERLKEPWTVSYLAQRAAVAALKDKAYRSETYRVISAEKEFLEKKFAKLGIEFYPSDANFYLIRTAHVGEVTRYLIERGIFVQDCSRFRGLDGDHLVVAVKSHKENATLVKELANLPGEGA